VYEYLVIDVGNLQRRRGTQGRPDAVDLLEQLNNAGQQGFRFVGVVGSEPRLGGQQVIMEREVEATEVGIDRRVLEGAAVTIMGDLIAHGVIDGGRDEDREMFVARWADIILDHLRGGTLVL